jgi:protein phosphatase
MGTTVTAARLHDGVVDLAHVGDSRAYLWRDGGLRRLTDDHSVVGEMMRDGRLSEEDAESHPHRNVITRALGAEPAIRVDTPSESLAGGDVLLVCSDGLTSQVRDEEIAAVLADAPALQDAADRLVELANAAGGVDNVTVVLARAGSDAAPGPGDGRTTAPIRLPVDRVGAAPSGRPPKGVLTPVPRRRHGLRPLVVAVVVVALLIAGGLSWLWSRTFAVEDRDGRVAVARGFPVEIAGLDLQTTWQDTGLDAGTVAAAESDALGSSALGRGEAVLRATRLVWTYGVPSPVVIEAPPPDTPVEPSGGTSP